MSPAAIDRLGPGEYEIDCGVNLSARPFLEGPRSAREPRHGDVAEQKGHPWEGHSYTYTLKGDGDETFVPRFTYFSFQYLYVSGVDSAGGCCGRRADVRCCWTWGVSFSPVPPPAVGEFQCSSPLAQ